MVEDVMSDWKSFKDILPEYGQPVLVYGRGFIGSEFGVYIAELNNMAADNWSEYSLTLNHISDEVFDFQDILDVEFWQDLPKPPKKPEVEK